MRHIQRRERERERQRETDRERQTETDRERQTDRKRRRRKCYATIGGVRGIVCVEIQIQ